MGKPKPPSRFPSPLDKAKGHEVIWQNVAPLFDAARPYQDMTYVYFIGEQDNGAVKIGLSKDPVGRLRTMQTGNARRLRIEFVLAGHVGIERLMQEMWVRYAIQSARQSGKLDAPPGTEWFEPEIRAELEPILATAVAKQVEWLNGLSDRDENAIATDGERLIRQAHGEHGFVAQKRDQVRLLGATLGITVDRRSYI